MLTKAKGVLDGLQSGATIRDVVTKHKNDILDLQRLQLFQGQTSHENDFRPYYSEDLQPSGYFKSAESAKRYADWKQTLSYPIQAERNPNAPNLYINGKFHSELDVNFGAAAVEIVGSTIYSKNIMAKYGRGNFGLTPENWNLIFSERGGKAQLLDEIKNQLFA